MSRILNPTATWRQDRNAKLAGVCIRARVAFLETGDLLRKRGDAAAAEKFLKAAHGLRVLAYKKACSPAQGAC